MKDVDFRFVQPILKSDGFHGEFFVVPCKVLSIGGLIIDKRYLIEVEILDFYSGELVRCKGITYEGSLTIFNDANLTPPFNTTCKIVKNGKGGFNIIVYGIFNVGVLEGIFYPDDMLSERELEKVYNKNYKKLRKWIEQ